MLSVQLQKKINIMKSFFPNTNRLQNLHIFVFTQKYRTLLQKRRDCRGRDRMVDEFTTNYAIGAYHH